MKSEVVVLRVGNYLDLTREELETGRFTLFYEVVEDEALGLRDLPLLELEQHNGVLNLI